MVKQIKWLDRKFEFTQPAGMMPVNLARMFGAIPRIKDIILSCSEEVLSHMPGGEWSIKIHIGHLTDLEELHESRLTQILAGAKDLAAADMLNRKTNEANHNDRKAIDLFEDFRKVRNGFISRLEKMDENQVLLSAMHPRLMKPMRIIDIAYFTAEHDDQHITIMHEIRKQLLKK